MSRRYLSHYNNLGDRDLARDARARDLRSVSAKEVPVSGFHAIRVFLCGSAFLLTIGPCAAAQGALWRDLGLPADGRTARVTRLASTGDALWAGTQDGTVFRSASGRDGWRVVLRSPKASSGIEAVTGIAKYGGAVYVGFGWHFLEGMGGADCFCDPSVIGGLYRTTDDGATWTALRSTGVDALYADSSGLFMATHEGLSVSRDGLAWNRIGLPADTASAIHLITGMGRLRENSGFLLMGLHSGAGGSADIRLSRLAFAGQDSLVPSGRPIRNAAAFAIGTNSDVLAATSAGLYHLRPFASAWDSLGGPGLSWICPDSLRALASPQVDDPALYSVIWNSGSSARIPLAGPAGIRPFCLHQGSIFGVGTSSNSTRLPVDAAGPVYRLGSDADRQAWLPAGQGMDPAPAAFVAASGGATWIAKSDYAGSSRVLARPHPSDAWSAKNPFGSRDIRMLAAADGRAFAGLYPDWVMASTDTGWSRFDTADMAGITDIAAAKGWMAAYAPYRGTLRVCEESGSGAPRCAQRSAPLPMSEPSFAPGQVRFPANPKRLAAEGNLLAFARESLYVSPDRGISWLRLGPPPGLIPVVIRIFQGRLFVAGTSLSPDSARAVAAVSADSGRTWARLGPAIPGTRSPFSLVLRPGEAYAATDSGVFRWKEGAGRWDPRNDGLPERDLADLALDEDRLIAGLASGAAWELPLEPLGLRADRLSRPAERAPETAGAFRDAKAVWRRADGRALPVVPRIGR
jgi:photosystem II stability/assembly factor-like uncharacterized protein